MFSSALKIFSNYIIRSYATLDLKCSHAISTEGPFIICANHSSHLDSAIIMRLFGGSYKNYALLAAYDYWFENKLRRFIFTNALNLIPIDRRKRGEKIIELGESIDLCRKFLTKRPKGRIIIFPNGSRLNPPDDIKPGVAILALELGLNIIVVRLNGTDTILPSKSHWFKKSKIEVVTYPPLDIQSITSDGSLDNREKVDNILWQIKTIFNGRPN
jgi:1-acyl-sn-glycerol-3-phosphate acyltransferase